MQVPEPVPGPDRRAATSAAVPQRRVVTLDVGGTTIKGATVDETGAVLDRRVVPTGAQHGPDHVVTTLRAVAADLAAAGGTQGGTAGTVAAAGVCVPGLVDTVAGRACTAANLGWRDVPLRALLEEDLGVPVALENDVRAATVAEVTVGLGSGTRDLVVVVLGTGVAAGVVVGGRITTGHGGIAGELGHLPVHPGGEPCPCGQRGCLEAYCGGAGIVRRYRAAGGPPGVSVADLVARRGKDRFAARVWGDATTALGLALASCTLLLDPALVVLAGGLAAAGPALLDPVRAALAGALAFRDAPPVVASPLGADAGRTGAAVLAWNAAGRPDLAATWVLPREARS